MIGEFLSRNEDLGWRVLCVLACLPSGGALLAKVYGLASLQTVTRFVFVPCLIFLVFMWWWAGRTQRDTLSKGLTIGFWGGLLGTLAYDFIRIPFLVLLGQRVFAPISIYGVWLADAGASSQLTHALGWAYHFSNGITFGIMYALLMRRRHWAWAILWGLVLETIAILSPFAQIFNLAGNYGGIAIAYLGHVAYGLPLGWLVYKWDETGAWLNARPVWLRRVAPLMVGLLAFLLVALWPAGLAKDGRQAENALIVEGTRLNPAYLRLASVGGIRVVNPAGEPAVTIVNRTNDTTLTLESGAETTLSFNQAGIYQLFVQTDGRTYSSLIIVEPVEDLSP